MSSGGASMRKIKRTTSEMRKQSKKANLAMVPRYLRTRGTPNGVHQFRRTVSAAFNVSSNGIQIPGGAATYVTDFAIRFGLQNCLFVGSGTTSVAVPGITELTALFDQIKLDKVVVRIISLNDSAPIATFQNFAVQVATAIDYNSDQTVTGAQLREYSSWKLDTIEPGGTVEHRRTLRPMYQRAITYTGGAGINGVEGARGFLGTISGDIAHYGLLGNIIAGNQVGQVNFFVEYYYSCKNQK